MRSFIKWVGGKHQLLPHLLKLCPTQINTYYEPFLGGGALFFALASEQRFQRASLNDRNQELIHTYRVVRDFPEDLMERLSCQERVYAENPRATYQEWVSRQTQDPLDRAVRFIGLNKTGFNGLYRVNRSGKFNVPWGKRPTAKLFEPTAIQAAHQALNRWVCLLNDDFEAAVESAGPSDMVYLDPPYVPVSPTASFTGYTSEKWGMAAHERVARLACSLVARGCHVVVSNADTPVVRDIYGGFDFHDVPARRSINSKGTARGPVGELLIVGRPHVV